MKTLTLIIGILIPSIFYAQVTKQYSGDFEDGTTQHGKATYSYYEKNDERIKHGAFSYTSHAKSNEGSFNTSISGIFKNNFKDGNWNHSISFTDWDNGTGNYITGTVTLMASYTNGLPNGQWNFSEVSKSRIKKFTFNGYTWSPYTETKTSKATINFKNGKLAGSFSMEGFLLSDNYKGTFDDNGFCIKNLTVCYSPTFKTETSVDYYKNTMTKSVTRDKSTGEVKEKTVLTPDEILTIQKFSDGQITSKELRNYHLQVDTVKLIKLETFEMNIFRKSLFLNEYLKGDKVFDESFDFGGYHIYTTKYELKKLSEIEGMESAESYMEDKTNTTSIKEALSRFENLKGQYANNLSTEDSAKVEAKITECKNIIEGSTLAEKQKNDRKNEWSEISGFSARSAKTSEIEVMLEKAKTFQKKYNDYLTEKDKNLANYNGTGIITTDANNDKELVEENINSLEQNLKIAIKNDEIDKQNVKIEEEQKKQEDLKKETTTVDKLYIVSRDAYDNVTVKKKNLYNAYQIVKKDMEEKRKGFENDLQNAIDTDNNIIKLCDKMISLENQDTSELEKSLKKETDPQKILSILGI